MNDVMMVIGLGFGDEGKGSVVDYLTRTYNAKLVVRFNGGAQTAHNVITPDGRHHTFSQFGSGTLAGARTLLSRFMLVNPQNMMREAAHLAELGIANPLSTVMVDRDAVITTPYHIAANRKREDERERKHGSCGLGIGESRLDELQGLAFRVRDIGTLYGASILGELARRHQMEPLDLMFEYEKWAKMVNIVRGIDTLSEAIRSTTVIFEGSQGVLIDEKLGYQPHTTWTNCTFENANTLLAEQDAAYPTPRRIGVLRTYATRHGPGPFPTEFTGFGYSEPFNKTGKYQGPFRIGHFDAHLSQYAVNQTSPSEIALTHMDALSRTNPNVIMLGKNGKAVWDSERIRVLVQGHDFVPAVETLLDTRVNILSSGPTASNGHKLERFK